LHQKKRTASPVLSRQGEDSRAFQSHCTNLSEKGRGATDKSANILRGMSPAICVEDEVIQTAESHTSAAQPIFLWLLLIALAVVAIEEVKAPAPLPLTAPLSEFSAERALTHVRVLARQPHPVGSNAEVPVRKYLLSQLSESGLNPQVFDAPGIHNSPSEIVYGETHDVIGRLCGNASSGAILLMAHYDSVSHAPGAADDGSGVAAILETLRALRHGPALKNDVIVLFTDGEEAGLLGADAFVTSHPWAKEIGLVLNFEARGDRGASLIFETGNDNHALMAAVNTSTPHPIGSSLFYSLYKLLPSDTDFTIFHRHHTPGLNFAFGENLEAYHSALDTIDNLSPASLQHHGSYALGLTRHFGQIDLAELKSPSNAVFFNILGSIFVTYSERWVLPAQALATALLLAVLLLAAQRQKLRVPKVMLAVLPSTAFLLIIPALSAGVAIALFRAISARMITGDCLANSLLLAGLVLIEICISVFLYSLCRNWFTSRELSLGGLIVSCALTWTIALILPAASYLLFWPFLLLTGGMLAIVSIKNVTHSGQILAVAPGTAVTVLLFVPIAYLLYIFLTLQWIVAAATGLLVASFLVLCIPFIDVAIPQGQRRRVLLPLLIAGAISIGLGIMMSHPSASHPKRDTVLYSENGDDRSAKWISYDTSTDRWTKDFFLNGSSVWGPIPDYLGGAERAVLSIPAAPIDLAAPTITVGADERDSATRTIKLLVTSPRSADRITIAFDEQAQPTLLKIGAQSIEPRQISGPLIVRLIGLRDRTTAIELTFRSNAKVSFWLEDESSGLPASAPGLRPPQFLAGYGSDVTVVCRKYML
jgi:hypothetical protein